MGERFQKNRRKSFGALFQGILRGNAGIRVSEYGAKGREKF
jgi:hypothetical protein